LVALRDRERGRRYGVRWLQRWLDEAEAPTIEDAVLVTSCLAALGGRQHVPALDTLRALAVGSRRGVGAPGAAVSRGSSLSS
jgi:hypothetical protein